MSRVRFYLNTPLAIYAQKPPQPLMFDGILGYAWALKNGYLKNPSELHPDNLVFPELPLEKVGEKCYAASAAFIPHEATMYPTLFNRRSDWVGAMARYGTNEMRYEVAVGWQQACQEPYWELATPYVDFYFLGDIKEVTELLSLIFKIRHLGSKRSVGYGFIRKIELKEDVDDWSVWRDGQPTRPIPVADAGTREGLTTEWATYYPPYWNTVNSAWCYTPPPEQWMPTRKVSDIEDDLSLYFNQKKDELQTLTEKRTTKSA